MPKYKTIFSESGEDTEEHLNRLAAEGYRPILMSTIADEESPWDSIICVKDGE